MENSKYAIFEITDYGQLLQYKNYTEWCIIFTEMAYEYYLDFGKRRLFVLEREHYKSLSPIQTENYPYDNYGLSLIAVITNNDRSLSTVTTRWNSFEENEESVTFNDLRRIMGKDIQILLRLIERENVKTERI